jgi:hypothetical protein
MASEEGSGVYQATYPGFQNGGERHPVEQYFFETVSHVGELGAGGSDTPAVNIGVVTPVDLRLRDRR